MDRAPLSLIPEDVPLAAQVASGRRTHPFDQAAPVSVLSLPQPASGCFAAISLVRSLTRVGRVATDAIGIASEFTLSTPKADNDELRLFGIIVRFVCGIHIH
jgi:hypothetical protein